MLFDIANLISIQASNNINNNNNNRNNNNNDNNQNNNNVNVANLASMQMNMNMVMVGRKIRRQFGDKSSKNENEIEGSENFLVKIRTFGEKLAAKVDYFFPEKLSEKTGK